MIDELKPYPTYKDSGSPWLGKVPTTWGVHSLRTLIKPHNERNRADLPLLSVAREKGVFVRSLTDPDENHNVIPEDLSNYKVARLGNLVINKMKAWQGSMGVAPCDGIVSPAYFVFDLRIPNRFFAQTMFRSKPYVAHFGQASDGVRVGQWDLSIPGMREIPVLLPTPDEQAAIVRFLDHANGKIERAIRAKRKLIALLNEQKQAIIHRAVTRGLDPAVKLKPSGIPWLGDVPEHWEVLRAKNLFHQVTPPIPENAEQVTCFRDGQVTLRRNRRTTGFTNAIWELGYQGIAPGQLVLHSMDAFAGAIGISDSSGKCSPEYVICEPSMEALCSDYYALILRSLALRGLFVALCPSVRERAPRVRYSDFGSFVLPKPPRSEQEAIVQFVRRSCTDIEMTLAQARRETELLTEYRTRLTADVVTGKVDVRAAVKLLPTVAEELLPADDLPDDEDVVEDGED